MCSLILHDDSSEIGHGDVSRLILGGATDGFAIDFGEVGNTLVAAWLGNFSHFLLEYIK